MNFIEKKVEKILEERGIRRPDYPEKEKFIKYRYPIKDEITEEIITWKEISGEELKNLKPLKRRKIRDIAEKIVDEKNYQKELTKYEEAIELYKKQFEKTLNEIVDKKAYNKFKEIMNTLYEYDIDVTRNIDKNEKEEFEKDIYNILIK